MTDPVLEKSVFVVIVAVYTLVTAWTDLRLRKIYNQVTVPMWVAGWIYHGIFHGGEGIVIGLQGFAVGFGLFFTLWMIGSAGGGDVKLVGALSVWLGPGLTLKVILVSLIYVVIGTIAIVAGGVFRKGWQKTSERYARQNAKSDGENSETTQQRAQRRVMGFAMPVALATWSVLALFRNQW